MDARIAGKQPEDGAQAPGLAGGTAREEAQQRAMRSPEERFLREIFSRYYQRAAFSVRFPERREFGFGGWEKKIEFRHIGVRGEGELRARLVSESPLYVSHSVAYYEYPEARPMVRKNWLGADLVFDLDAESHSCGKFTCQQCLDRVKGDAIKLIEEFLVPDFGFSRKEIAVNFSGSRGYHLHVRSDAVLQLDREARREIADYVAGNGLSFERLFWNEGKKLFGPKPSDGGYGGKFARAFIERMKEPDFALSISRKLKSEEEREKLASSIMEGNWDSIGIASREKKMRQKFEEMRLTMAGRIDANVTADTSKLIRLPGSLHGGSGFCAASCANLDSFEPMRDAPAFREGELEVRALEDTPMLLVAGREARALKKGEAAALPMAAAVYLLCKKAAALA